MNEPATGEMSKRGGKWGQFLWSWFTVEKSNIWRKDVTSAGVQSWPTLVSTVKLCHCSVHPCTTWGHPATPSKSWHQEAMTQRHVSRSQQNCTFNIHAYFYSCLCLAQEGGKAAWPHSGRGPPDPPSPPLREMPHGTHLPPSTGVGHAQLRLGDPGAAASAFIAPKWKKLIIISQERQFFNRRSLWVCCVYRENEIKGAAVRHNI